VFFTHTIVSAWELRVNWNSFILSNASLTFCGNGNRTAVPVRWASRTSVHTPRRLNASPQYLQESLLYLPDIPNLIRYSKPFQAYQCFHMKNGLEQGLCRVFASCSFHATPGRRLQMNSQKIQALSNNSTTANHRCSGPSEAARRQETEHHESLICCITLACFCDITNHGKPKSRMINHLFH
jgi:hypothetical protein